MIAPKVPMAVANKADKRAKMKVLRMKIIRLKRNMDRIF